MLNKASIILNSWKNKLKINKTGPFIIYAAIFACDSQIFRFGALKVNFSNFSVFFVFYSMWKNEKNRWIETKKKRFFPDHHELYSTWNCSLGLDVED